MSMRVPPGVIVLALLGVAGCTTIPTGPGVMVLPGSGKSFEQFRADDQECRNYALEGVGGKTPGQAMQESGVQSAVVGTVVGAAAGAALGGHEGAAAGAGTGLVVGGLAGTGYAQASGYGLQHRYDVSYVQCMYSKGHQVPVSGQPYRPARTPYYLPPPVGAPPPPPGYPPPPPPQ
jgi:uncharacterized protein YcfJ